jgi:signal transduction histidine kinase
VILAVNTPKEGIVMKRIVVSTLLVALLFSASAFVVQAATRDDAKAFAEKAVAYWKANGKEKAVAEFNNPKGQFVKGDMYIVIQGFDGVLLANGGNPALVGQNHLELKDPNGKQFVKEMVEAAKKGGGWVTYSWTNPVTKKIGTKKAWIKQIEGEQAYVNCGVFQ